LCEVEGDDDTVDLAITKSDSPDAVRAGNRLGYSLTVTNNGPGTAFDVTVIEDLDPFTTFVSASVPCTPIAGIGLSCDLGAMLSGEVVTFDIQVDVHSNAPTAGSNQFGLCNADSDLCNIAAVTTSSNDTDASNDSDEEPTNVLPPPPGGGQADCGDGVVEGLEQCDPPSSEDCANTFDDDFDGLIDCSDPDCLTGQPTCSATCEIVPQCQPILNDPATIKFGKNGAPDMMSMHARFEPYTPIDLYTEPVRFSLSNANGVIYRASLFPGDMKGNSKGTSFKFTDSLARMGRGKRSGISKFLIKAKLINGVLTYPFTFQVYGDFSKATLPDMTTEIMYGTDIASLSATWVGSYPKGWQLSMSILNAQ
ncbi:MAG TPA: DUF11 domain-containing protein, partial [Candidatus Binatia bacterium]|nr:DUF11 domain-containing protein [Candidatus Binatia bacterium]